MQKLREAKMSTIIAYLFHLRFVLFTLLLLLALKGNSQRPVYISVYPSELLIQNNVLYNVSGQFFGMSGLQYSLIHSSSCERDHFHITPDTGMLYTAQSINLTSTLVSSGYNDFTNIDSASTDSLSCVGNGTIEYPAIRTYSCFAVAWSTTKSHAVSVEIHVIPQLNGLSPFTSSAYTGSVPGGMKNALAHLENFPLIIAYKTETSLPTIDYIVTATNNSDNGSFKIVLTTRSCYSVVEFVTTKPLSIGTIYNFTLYHTPTQSQAHLLIGVVGENMHSPEFVDVPFSLRVNESLIVGANLLQVRAVDVDSGPSGLIRYSVYPHHSPIRINHVTGILYLSSVLDHERENHSYITVRAYDLGYPSRSTETNITIFIDDTNEAAPHVVFRSTGGDVELGANFAIPELTPIGSTLAKIVLTDEDSSNISLIMVSNTCPYCFSLQLVTSVSHSGVGSSMVVYNLVLQSKLDYEGYRNSHKIIVKASDSGTPPLSTLRATTIQLLDQNEPTIISSFKYKAFVSRGEPIGSHVILIRATDEDNGVNGQLVYSIVSGNDNNWFSINSLTGLIKVSSSSLQPGVVRLNVSVQDSSSSPLASYATLKITVTDTDTHIPVFSASTYSTSLSESWNESVPVFDFNASDVDTGCSGSVEYSILFAEPESFIIDSISGLLYLNHTLDYEEYQSGRVVVSAHSLGNSPDLVATATLNINVLDVSDGPPLTHTCPCRPQFLTSQYNGVVKEDADVGFSILTVKAIDRDQNNAITYSLSQSNDKIDIDPSTGELTLTSTLDRDTDAISFTVTATDQSSLSSSVPVSLRILHTANSHRPSFTPSTNNSIVTIPENATVSQVLFTAQASDSDTGINGELRYWIHSGNTGEAFYLDSATGEVRLSHPLDYESDLHTFSLLIDVTDLGTPPLQTGGAWLHVTFLVRDVNDNRPEFTQEEYTCSIVEGGQLKNGSGFCQVQAIDSNGTGSNVVYSIVNGSSDFILNSTTGVLSVIDLLSIDYEVRQSYILVVLATDNGSPPLSSTSIVTISVLNTNDNQLHFDSSLFTIKLPLHMPINTTLFSAHAFDRDGNESTITYSLVGNNDKFSVSSSGLVSTKTEIVDAVNFTLKILALESDQIGRSNDYHLLFSNGVNFNSAPPQFLTSNKPILSVSRRAQVGTHLVSMATLDPDVGLNGIVRYFIVAGSGFGYFIIDANNGSISIRSELTAVTVPTLSLVIMAIDSGPHQLYSLFNLTVVIMKDYKPLFESAVYYYTANDSHSFSFFIIGRVHVLGESEHNVSYVIPSGQGVVPFSINASTGAMSVTGELNKDSYSFRVEAYDHKTDADSSSCLVIVRVRDTVNNFRPEFPSNFDSFFLPSSFLSNTTFIRLFVTDGDREGNAKSTFSVSNPLYSPINIRPVSGELYLKFTPPNLSTVITVVAQNGALTGDHRINFTLYSPDLNAQSDLNLITPNTVFLNISESTMIGEIVYTISANNNGKPIFYYLLNEDSHTFAVHLNTGAVYLTKLLDYEEQSNYTLSFLVSDGGNNHLSLNITLLVLDIDDNPPTFTQETYAFNILENSPPATLIGSLSVNDTDSLINNVTYSIIDARDSGSLSLFNISSLGFLALTGNLDREVLSSHLLTVSVISGSWEHLSRLLIIVKDENDNTPQFIEPLDEVSVTENSSIGDIVSIITAFDPDQGDNGNVSYSLTNAQSVPFRIDPNTGAIFVDGHLDYEETSEYTLNVMAYNPNNLSSNKSETIRISVSNLIDTYPVLSGMEVSVYENGPSHSYVANIAISNPHPVIYTIVNGNELNHFYIEPFSGTLRNLIPLDREALDVYNLTIRGSYNDRFYTDVYVMIRVRDINDHSPYSSASILTFVVSEGTTVSTEIIFDLSPVDPDQGSNGTIRSIIILDSVSNSFFDIDAEGHGRLKRSLDRETQERYQFNVVMIDDGSSHSLHTTSLVTIIVSDVNDNDPIFTHLPPSLTLHIETPILPDEILYTVKATDADDGANGRIVKYFIDGGSGVDVFRIDPLTGDLSAIERYNMESNYSLIVGAKDGGGRNGTVSFKIVLTPCRFNNLAFTPSAHSIVVPEDAHLGSVLLSPLIQHFNVTGNFNFTLSREASHFRVNSSTGQLLLHSPLDREQQHLHHLVLLAYDLSSAQVRVAKATISVTISDVNDNAPLFIGLPYAQFISDTVEGGTEIFTIRATDLDSNNNSLVTYSIISDPSSSFLINESTGVIFLNHSLDPSALDMHFSVLIGAEDQGFPKLKSNTTLRITLINSNAPNFSLPLYSTTLSEGTSAGTTVVTLYAEARTDNALLFYSISNTGDLRFPFSINPQTGVITVNDRGLDYESRTFYSFFVQAEEVRSGLYSQATVEVTVTDENDQTPTFSEALYIINVEETISIGAMILRVQANDSDTPPNAQLSFSLSSSNFFRVNPETGEIITTHLLDYEEHTSHQLTVRARDSGNPPLEGSASVRIIVTNVNDNHPSFLSLSPLSISEGADPGTVLTFVRATDTDNDDITYSLVPYSDEGYSNFELLPNGLLRLNPANVSLTEIQYSLNISASDGKHSTYATLVINIDDINNHSPVFNQSTYITSIIENSASGVPLVSVSASDADRGINAEISYSLFDSTFHINTSTGLVSTSSVNIDRETTSSYSLIVIARDGGGLTDTALVTVTVLDVNDNIPSFTQSSFAAFLPEQEDYNNHPVLTVVASDPDNGVNGSLTYRITSSTNLFSINPSTGVIVVTGSLDYEATPSYTLNVSATDGGGLVSDITMVAINVTNVADTNPSYSQDIYNVAVPENTLTGTIFTPSVTFSEGCTPSGYAIFGGGAGPFRYNGEGNIMLAGSLDRENRDSYSFTITVECTITNLNTNPPVFETRFDGAAVNITVTDVNERPIITSKLFLSDVISEGSALNSTVTIVKATDSDLGLNSTVRYRLDTAETPFDVDPVSGAVIVSEPLDRETKSSYTFRVVAYDLGSPPLSSSATIIIALQDINDSPPSFICSETDDEGDCYYNVTVAENIPLNSAIALLETQDPDLVGTTTFILNNTLFNVSSSNRVGVIRIAQSLDRETSEFYNLRLIASDGIFTVRSQLFVAVTDVNDNAPVFSQDQFIVSLSENYPTHSVFITLNATDSDLGDNAVVTFTLLSSPSSANLSLSSTTGQVMFLVSPDREVSERLEFYLKASDVGGLEDFATLTVNIIDKNDNVPVFMRSNYNTSIFENRTSSAEVILVSASDADSGSNGLIKYSLDQESTRYFTIDPVTGLIRARNYLIDREKNESFTIIVTASDSGEEIVHSSETAVEVAVMDVNDNAPLFTESDFTLYVYENASIGTVIDTFVVTDADEGLNAQLTFDLTGKGKDSFTWEATRNGVSLKVNAELNSESRDLYHLTLTATDSGIPALKSSVSLNIMVLDRNEHLPTFERPLYSYVLSEDVDPGTTVAIIVASDLDPADANLTYRFKGNVSDFKVDEVTGVITIGDGGLDYERVRNYSLTLFAVEPRPGVPQTAQTVIEVTVTDVNDNPPRFLCLNDSTQFCPNQSYSVYENVPRATLATLSVRDVDTVTDHSLIRFAIASGATNHNNQEVFRVNPISGVLTLLVPLDREEKGTYTITVNAVDDGTPQPLVGYAYITINVLDVNDNIPTDGDQHIFINLLSGEQATHLNETVYANDSDIANSHSFVAEVGGQTSFNVNFSTGRITAVGSNLYPGHYDIRVKVHDTLFDGIIHNAITVVHISIINITQSIKDNSFTMLLLDVTPQLFISDHLIDFNSTLPSKVLNGNPDIIFLGINSSGVSSTELTLAVCQGNDCVQPDLIQHLLYINRQWIFDILRVNVSNEDVSHCSAEPCSNGGLCSETVEYSPSTSFLSQPHVSYLGLQPQRRVNCSCFSGFTGHNCSDTCSDCTRKTPCDFIQCPSMSTCSEIRGKAVCIDDCSSLTCRNGGRCIPQHPGHHCVCPPGYEGPNCELTTGTFTGTSYALFPSTPLVSSGQITLEFITQESDGLLLFSGHYSSRFDDHLVLYLSNNRVKCSMSLGGNVYLLEVTDFTANVKEWITVTLKYTLNVRLLVGKTETLLIY